jgi:hypothetical protein
MCSRGDSFAIAIPMILNDVEGNGRAGKLVGDTLLGSP